MLSLLYVLIRFSAFDEPSLKSNKFVFPSRFVLRRLQEHIITYPLQYITITRYCAVFLGILDMRILYASSNVITTLLSTKDGFSLSLLNMLSAVRHPRERQTL